VSSALVVPGQQSADRSKWWHDDPPDPQKYSGGRMEGTLKQLAHNVGVDPKTLRKMNRDGVVWIRRIHGTLWESSFSSAADYKRAYARHVKPE
jgi:hypothetical protein